MAYSYKEYPRTLHKAGGHTLTVRDDAEKATALAEGWALVPVADVPVVDEPARRRGRQPKERA